MKGPANAQAVQLNATYKSGAGSAGIITLAADAEQYWVIDSVHFGYSIVNAALEDLIITFGGVTYLTLPVPIPAAAGPSQQAFYVYAPKGGLYRGVVNQEVKLTLSAAAGALAYLNCTYR
jgi:hypothetical protein